ncbi:MAG: AraC family transcriptional regulator [Alphaproteobacteria bacterium]|nr:AraC family transcriptional regulator [Alphaproteobacteria bacterium]
MRHFSSTTTAAFMERYKQIDNLSIEEVEETFGKYVAPYEVTPTGKSVHNSGTSMSYFPIGDVELVCSHWGAPMIGTALADRGTLSIGLPISGVTELIDPKFGRIRTKPSEARLFSAGDGVSLVGLGPRKVMDLVLPLKTLEDRARSFHQNELQGRLQFSPVLDLNSPAGLLIVNLIEHIKTLAVYDAASMKNPLVTTNLKEHIISAVFEMLPHNYKEAQSCVIDCAVPKSVRRAEEYMRAFADQPVTVKVLASHAGCSERALHHAFKAFRQKTPMTVLRGIRLESAHDDLRSGDNTITDIVFKWGFSNPGRFSKLYAEKFGCKPSQTLRYSSG